MDTPVLVLASASQRRRRLIAWLGVPVTATASDVAEDISSPRPPGEIARDIASDKAHAVREAGASGTVLAFDTIVVHGKRVLGKPADRTDAQRMLRELSSAMHEVVTGVAILPDAVDRADTFAVTTPVAMRALSDTDIEAWVGGDECLGCAGAYNIEHHLASVADDQCFQNVAGLPLCHIYRELASGRAGAVPVGLTAPVDACDRALGRHCLLGPTVCADAR